jgi:hypothetical protein
MRRKAEEYQRQLSRRPACAGLELAERTVLGLCSQVDIGFGADEVVGFDQDHAIRSLLPPIRAGKVGNGRGLRAAAQAKATAGTRPSGLALTTTPSASGRIERSCSKPWANGPGVSWLQQSATAYLFVNAAHIPGIALLLGAILRWTWDCSGSSGRILQR